MRPWGAVRSVLKLGTEVEKFRNPCGQSVTVHELIWVPSLCIYVKMYALMCMRPELAEKIGFTK